MCSVFTCISMRKCTTNWLCGPCLLCSQSVVIQIPNKPTRKTWVNRNYHVYNSKKIIVVGIEFKFFNINFSWEKFADKNLLILGVSLHSVSHSWGLGFYVNFNRLLDTYCRLSSNFEFINDIWLSLSVSWPQHCITFRQVKLKH